MHLVTIGKALLKHGYNEHRESMNLSCEMYDRNTETKRLYIQPFIGLKKQP